MNCPCNLIQSGEVMDVLEVAKGYLYMKNRQVKTEKSKGEKRMLTKDAGYAKMCENKVTGGIKA